VEKTGGVWEGEETKTWYWSKALLGEDQSRTNRRCHEAGGHNELAGIEDSLKIRFSISVNE
jgi:hypothetical protein